jgi:Plasmid pRiA4b ORF-3-like protein
LQIASGWASTHLFGFQLKPPGTVLTHPLFSPANDLLKIVDNGAEEELDFSPYLPELPRSPTVKASKILIGKVLDDVTYIGAVIEYDYDFGDNWLHEIVVVGRETASDKFICVAGEGHGAAEDIHGPTGWEELKEAYRAEAPTGEQKGLRGWYENSASNKDSRGLGGDREWVWDQIGVNVALRRLRW